MQISDPDVSRKEKRKFLYNQEIGGVISHCYLEQFYLLSLHHLLYKILGGNQALK